MVVGMNEIPTAFPWTHDDMTCTGMTLRDYFAAKALQNMGDLMTKPYNNLQSKAEIAYQMADAMLAAREEK
jgi:hypothetical protein